MRKAYGVLSVLLVVLGACHTALTGAFYPPLTPDGAWFAGTGLALVFLGLLNLVGARAAGAPPAPTLVANGLGLAYMVLVVAVLPEGQAFVALGLMAGLGLLSALLRTRLGAAGLA